MKKLPPLAIASQWLSPSLLAGVLMFSAVQAADTAAEPKTHSLYQGANVTLEQNGKLCPVIDVAGDAFVVWSEGKEVSVPAKGASKMKVAPVMKLTENSAEIREFRSERAYTPANDPEVAFQRSLRQAARLAAEGMALSNQETAAFKGGSVSTSASSGGGSAAVVASQAGATSLAQQQATMDMQRSTGGPGSSMQLNRGASGSGGGFDAIKVAFEITAPRMLGRPFVVLTAFYRAPNTEPGKRASWVYARALKPIDAKPLKVEVEQGGFPLGFEFEDLQVHVYDNGQEVATNLSAKLQTMTQHEAHDYVVKDYVGRHKTGTLPARPAMGHLPPDFAARRQSGQVSGIVYVKVSPEGLPVEAFVDQACAQKVADPYVASVVGGILFLPALNAGQPAEGVTAIDFSKLVL